MWPIIAYHIYTRRHKINPELIWREIAHTLIWPEALSHQTQYGATIDRRTPQYIMKETVFVYEKRWNFDGPDGFSHLCGIFGKLITCCQADKVEER